MKLISMLTACQICMWKKVKVQLCHSFSIRLNALLVWRGDFISIHIKFRANRSEIIRSIFVDFSGSCGIECYQYEDFRKYKIESFLIGF